MGIDIAIARAAEAIEASAKEHKRLARLHRRKARDCMRELAALRAACAASGVRLIVNGEEEETTHGRETHP